MLILTLEPEVCVAALPLHAKIKKLSFLPARSGVWKVWVCELTGFILGEHSHFWVRQLLPFSQWKAAVY